MKKVLIALVLVIVLSCSSFALTLQFLNVLQAAGPDTVNAQTMGVGIGFEPMENVELVVGLTSYSDPAAKENSAGGMALKGYYDLGMLRVGLQLAMITVPTNNIQVAPSCILVGVKKTLVDGVDLVFDARLLDNNGATGADQPLVATIGGGQISISVDI